MTANLLVSDLFLRALAAGSISAVTSGAVGYFLVLRAQAFAAEALTDICFAGSAGAALAGFSPLLGMLAFAGAAGVGLGALGERPRGRDIETGMVLSTAVGLGVLFLSLYAHRSASHANAGINLLFGSILSVSDGEIRIAAACGAVTLLFLALISRPLLFATADPVVARARGLPMRALSIAFALLLALATSVCVLSMGALLAISILVAPAAAAARLSRGPLKSVLLSALLSLLVVWGGLLIAFAGPWRHPPLGFAVSFLAALLYFGSRLGTRPRARIVETGHPHGDIEVRSDWSDAPGTRDKNA
jgi:zinc/manganese transport system permease protein